MAEAWRKATRTSLPAEAAQLRPEVHRAAEATGRQFVSVMKEVITS
jgi:hypothetical protein